MPQQGMTERLQSLFHRGAKGFRPTPLEPEFVDPHSGELLCVNGLFQPAARIGAANA